MICLLQLRTPVFSDHATPRPPASTLGQVNTSVPATWATAVMAGSAWRWTPARPIRADVPPSLLSVSTTGLDRYDDVMWLKSAAIWGQCSQQRMVQSVGKCRQESDPPLCLQSHCECRPGYGDLQDGSCSLENACTPTSCHRNANCSSVGPGQVQWVWSNLLIHPVTF